MDNTRKKYENTATKQDIEYAANMAIGIGVNVLVFISSLPNPNGMNLLTLGTLSAYHIAKCQADSKHTILSTIPINELTWLDAAKIGITSITSIGISLLEATYQSYYLLSRPLYFDGPPSPLAFIIPIGLFSMYMYTDKLASLIYTLVQGINKTFSHLENGSHLINDHMIATSFKETDNHDSNLIDVCLDSESGGEDWEAIIIQYPLFAHNDI